jgi:hypothetical protein
MHPKKRMALAEAATSKGIRAGHVHSKTILRGLAHEGYLRILYGDTFEITPKGLVWLVSHGHATPRHAVGRSGRDPSESMKKLLKLLAGARTRAIRADKLSEEAQMMVFDVFNILKFSKTPLSSHGDKVLTHVDNALFQLNKTLSLR